jgi:hypothetical protein
LADDDDDDGGRTMATWADLADADADLAAAGARLLVRGPANEGMLATVLADETPRINPVNVAVIDGRLLTFVGSSSPKSAALAADGRFALHAHVDPVVPEEFVLRGRAHRVDDPGTLAAAVTAWPFDAASGYDLFELSIEHALLGQRSSADDWPPRYRSWRAPSG